MLNDSPDLRLSKTVAKSSSRCTYNAYGPRRGFSHANAHESIDAGRDRERSSQKRHVGLNHSAPDRGAETRSRLLPGRGGRAAYRILLPQHEGFFRDPGLSRAVV